MPESNSGPADHHATVPASTVPPLIRTMGLFSLIVYGVGDMVGAGIYGTVGKAAGQMGNAVWLAFIVSMVAALLTGLSYASIASRYPRAAGAAYVTQRAFRFSFLSYVVGLAVTASGLTSMATSSNVFAENLQSVVGGGPVWMWIALFLAFMTLVNFWGIRESMWTNLLCTTIEVGGLIFIIVIGFGAWGGVDYFSTANATFDSSGEMIRSGLSTQLLLSGAVLTFFSFIGFEDMLNVAEEVKQPERTMPWGIIIALAIAAVLYIGVSITAVSVVDYRVLAEAEAPLAEITKIRAPWLPGWVFTAITMFAVANTVLINYIMGSRLLYGMARQGLVPAPLGRVHRSRRTPHVAILTLLAVVLVLAYSGGIGQLATSTGLLLLACFVVVNAALILLKLRPGEPRGRFEVPILIPLLGILVHIALIAARIIDPSTGRRPLFIAGGLLLAIGLLYLILRPKAVTEESLAEIDHD